ncbi:DUF3040 domain-containing protein [Actinokineospora globicatena]|uniref:DUF3040 domain-containing protein n=1 Tax=Actinokineospora globicatena TaxID=103729 RepID=UPI0020A2D4E9|nr:DUF3040 domain-containing protein [Actinokineospora globicatena]MCP2303289.1 Protein of unknown function (DUF3040) [Actinokineospora globicatena]
MNPRGLSSHERRALEEIADRLGTDSPELASLLGEPARTQAPRLLSLMLSLVAGGVCVVAGVAVGAPLVVFIGMIAAVVVLMIPMPSSDEEGGSGAGR